jgi:hypothetical protein
VRADYDADSGNILGGMPELLIRDVQPDGAPATSWVTYDMPPAG